MGITIYHTRDVEKISQLISLALRVDKESIEHGGKHVGGMSRLIGDILNIEEIQDEGETLRIKMKKLCPSMGYEAFKPDKTKPESVFMYRNEREVYVHESLIEECKAGEHLGMVVTDILASYSGQNPSEKGGKTVQNLNVSAGHFDLMLVGFDEQKPAYNIVRNYFGLRLGITPAVVDRESLEGFKQGVPDSGVFWGNPSF